MRGKSSKNATSGSAKPAGITPDGVAGDVAGSSPGRKRPAQAAGTSTAGSTMRRTRHADPAIVHDHPFTPRPGNPYLCVRCRLAEPAHAETAA